MGLSDGVHFTILLSLCWAQYRRVTDIRTDGRTSRCRKDRVIHSVARVKCSMQSAGDVSSGTPQTVSGILSGVDVCWQVTDVIDMRCGKSVKTLP